jgi:hypothetical protein
MLTRILTAARAGGEVTDFEKGAHGNWMESARKLHAGDHAFRKTDARKLDAAWLTDFGTRAAQAASI